MSEAEEEPATFETSNMDVMLTALDIMARGVLFIGVDSTRADVTVPENCRGNPQLTLSFGWNEYLNIPVENMSVDVLGIRGDLRFNGARHRCDIPWAAVWRAVGPSYRSVLWPNRMPDGLRLAVVSEHPEQAAVATDVDPPGAVVRELRSVPESRDQPPVIRDIPSSAPTLRVVRDVDDGRSDD